MPPTNVALPEANPGEYQPPPGRVGNLTVIQQHTLTKFRAELEKEGALVPERHDDPTLLRFLRARKFDLVKAKEMILAQEKWRKEFMGVGVDEYVKNFTFKNAVEVDKFYPQYYHKTDKDGRPIYIEQLGGLAGGGITKLYQITTKDELIGRLVYEYEKFINERLPACSTEIGHPLETSCTILDLKGIGMTQWTRDVREYVGAASTIGQNYYPECMGRFFIINSPSLFGLAWRLISGWLDPVTVAKISIHTEGADQTKKLLEQIPAENLPVVFGGKCECVGGCSMADQGPWNKGGAKAVTAGEAAQ